MVRPKKVASEVPGTSEAIVEPEKPTLKEEPKVEEPKVTLESDADALKRLHALLNERPMLPAAITSIEDGVRFTIEYERWDRKVKQECP